MAKKVIMAACLVLCLTGCSLWPGRNAADQNAKNWNRIGPAHKKYIDADATISDTGKKARKLFVDEATKLAETMKENAR